METSQIDDHAEEDQISDDEASSLYVDFENNGLLWVPPEPENDDDDYYGYDYDDDDDDDDAKQVVEEPPRLEQVFKYSPSEHESIKVLLSSRCEWKGTVCERSHLLRIKYYDSFDRPFGRFLLDRLFDQNSLCSSCEMPPEAHVECYTHRQGTISISVKKLPDLILPREKDGKIWMWHRCLRCPRAYYGLPPASRRLLMSDATSGLSFGKFLELSFSNDATVSCGHSLHRDCLRFYGFGEMVACFRYASVEVYSVYLSPSKLNFNNESGPRMLLLVGVNDPVTIPVYNDEPSSIISYALVSSDYNSIQASEDEPVVSFADNGPHGEVKFKYTVTCYYSKRFEELRRMWCSSETDFVRSLSRCDKWGASGGESKTLDGRFIVKQVTKTELESFIKFASRYFEYVSESIGSGFPTCLAKMFGVYEVTSRHLKNGKETKMYLVVIENILFGKNPSRLYDLKGSMRSRYNPDPSGSNNVLLDQNLIEEMPTSPIYVGNESKRLLERAIWNDTAFLASIDVMDYSLIVGVDDEKHELVCGIINIMRQYTWDKHLETWFTASVIFGGPKNISPTIVNPSDYKKRFRKAMSAYFMTVPCSQAELSNENSHSSAQSTTFSDP